MNYARTVRLALTIGGAVLLASCQIDSTAPMRAFDIKNVVQTGVPVAVNAAISAVFASKSWCQDDGARAIAALGSAAVPIQPVSCKEVGGQGAGQFRLTTSLVRTAGARDPSTVVEEVLGGNLVRFAVFPHGKQKDLLSVGIFLDVARLEAAKAELVKMPVFKEGLYAGEVGLTFSIVVTNDLPNTAKFYLKDVAADADLPSDESVLELPSGGTETITLDPEKQSKLMQQGWVNFFAMAALP
jgi:hypothetical protein